MKSLLLLSLCLSPASRAADLWDFWYSPTQAAIIDGQFMFWADGTLAPRTTAWVSIDGEEHRYTEMVRHGMPPYGNFDDFVLIGSATEDKVKLRPLGEYPKQSPRRPPPDPGPHGPLAVSIPPTELYRFETSLEDSE